MAATFVSPPPFAPSNTNRKTSNASMRHHRSAKNVNEEEVKNASSFLMKLAGLYDDKRDENDKNDEDDDVHDDGDDTKKKKKKKKNSKPTSSFSSEEEEDVEVNENAYSSSSEDQEEEKKKSTKTFSRVVAVSYTHLTLPTNREV